MSAPTISPLAASEAISALEQRIRARAIAHHRTKVEESLSKFRELYATRNSLYHERLQALVEDIVRTNSEEVGNAAVELFIQDHTNHE